MSRYAQTFITIIAYCLSSDITPLHSFDMILTPGEMQFFAFIAKELVDIAFFMLLWTRAI